MLTPVTSLGSRSGVNWIRRTVASIDAASAFASMVLPTPGTSSSRRCPSASRTISDVRTTSVFPSMTVSTAERIASAISATAATSGRGPGAGRGTRVSPGSVAIRNLPAGAGAFSSLRYKAASDSRVQTFGVLVGPTGRWSGRFPDAGVDVGHVPYRLPPGPDAASGVRFLVETLLQRVAGELDAVVQLELVEGVLHVVLHGAVRHRQPVRDLLAGQPGRDQPQ